MTNTKLLLGFLFVLALAFLIGRWSSEQGHGALTNGAANAAIEADVWTCPMHPEIRLPDPGDCPVCSMDLVPSSSDGEGQRTLTLSEDARRLARIETAPVERRFVDRAVRMSGKVDFDETTMRSISAWVPGRLDRLFVDYTGVRVEAGDHLVRLYSPELTTAQEELLAAHRRLEETGAESDFLTASDGRAYRSAREKLVLWGLSEAQVDEIVARGTAEDHVTLSSPVSGVVVHKDLDEGAYVQTGTHIYSIADLTHLWVRLDAYEQDLPWLQYGQEVTLEAEGLPGSVLHGKISFIDPIVDARTRTVKVRVNVDNSDGRLKPGMFVRAVARARMGAHGRLLDRRLAGKWVSPMHPEIVKDGPGHCDVCGMDLVRAEALGLVGAEAEEMPLVVPASAVLLTGKRAVCYVELADAEEPTYEGREIVVGAKAEGFYVVAAGLAVGERVVTNGAFRIDSAMQIRAQPSMMSIKGETSHVHGYEVEEFRMSIQPAFDDYLRFQTALTTDDTKTARTAVAGLAAAFAQVDDALLHGESREAWTRLHARLAPAVEAARRADDLEALRGAFEPIAHAMVELERTFGHATDVPYAEGTCPMAFGDRASTWLQAAGEVANPYMGAAMPRCGTLTPIGAR